MFEISFLLFQSGDGPAERAPAEPAGTPPAAAGGAVPGRVQRPLHPLQRLRPRQALCRRPLLADKAGTARFGGTLARGPVCIVEDLDPQSDPGFLLNANPQPDMKKIQLFYAQQPPSPVFPIWIH